jgi:nitrogen fixation/metabolism regulation signal transduction histidine kinase
MSAGPEQPASAAAESPRADRRTYGAFWVALPPALAAVLLAAGPSGEQQATLVLGASALASLLLAVRAERTLARRLRTISSVLAAYRQGDFSIRARVRRHESALGAVLAELNQLGEELREHRLGELEAWTLLRKVLSEVDVVVLAFDEFGRVKLANEAAEKALQKRQHELVDHRAAELGLEELLGGNAPRVVTNSFALGKGPWELRRGSFRMSGEPHTLIVLPDVGQALRAQEREAWKRLIVVMGHEINNSLAPIQSIAENLGRALEQAPRPDDWEEDLSAGLSIVARRAEGLGRFMAAYANLARLPPPVLARMDVTSWIERVAALEQRVCVEVTRGPELALLGDADQLDQLLINLLKNAADATLPHPGGVRVSWSRTESTLSVTITDNGPGVLDTANLFVPFFTTKPGGSGIGLVLARQIAEAHGGEVTLTNRADTSGAIATIRLPISGG